MPAKSKKTAKKKSASPKSASRSGNGLKTFAMHALDSKTAPMFAKLTEERATAPAFSLVGPQNVEKIDPETAAKHYLDQALESSSVPALTAPKTTAGDSEFKSLGTETIPLTNTTTVKFRQTLNQIPIYGSLVTVEMDDSNNLLSINSSVGEPKDAPSVATISQADAIKAVKSYPGYRKDLAGIVPHLNYYFDNGTAKWRLVFILEDVPVTVDSKQKGGTPLPHRMDYVVDAQSAKVIAELPRTPSMAAATEQAVDGLNKPRSIQVEINGAKKLLSDKALNVQTFDFKFDDPQDDAANLPGAAISSPPVPWPPSAVSAHANAAAVAQFLRTVLRRNNIDNKGGPMNSSINCVVQQETPGGNQWFNAFWNGSQMVYGQRKNGTGLMSLAVDLDVVGHEMFHGVTDSTARLEYVAQSGALNESYSDIFGIIIANFDNPNTLTWNWKVGEGLSPDGKPFRDMQKPSLFGQPENMKNFVKLPLTRKGDNGGVHTNSGIHNKAAYNILTAKDSSGQLVFKPAEAAAIFYLALTQQLSRTSQFSDSRRAVITSARTFFRTLPAAQLAEKITAIEDGFSAVGIK